jgi:hypothetical protein
MARDSKITYDAVAVHFTDESDPVVIERVSDLVKSCFPGSRDPALQVIDIPTLPTGGGLFDMEVNLFRPAEVDHLVLKKGDKTETARLEDLFEDWDW